MRRLAPIGALLVLASSASGQDAGEPRIGEAFARTVCAACHGVARGETASRDSRAPSFQTLADTPGITAIALRVALRSSHRDMPNLMLSDQESANVIAFILDLRTR